MKMRYVVCFLSAVVWIGMVPKQARGQDPASLFDLFQPMAGKTWVGHYLGSPEDEHLTHLIRWDALLGGAAIRKVKHVPEVGYCELTVYHWDPVTRQGSFLSLTNLGHVSRGRVGREGQRVLVSGTSVSDTEVGEFVVTFHVDPEGRLQDEFFRVVGGVREKGHHITYEPDLSASRSVACHIGEGDNGRFR